MTTGTAPLKCLAWVLILALVLAGSAAQAKGAYGSHAVALSGVGDGRTALASPDGRSRVVVRNNDAGLTVQTSGAIGKLSFTTEDAVAAELTWSPDSRAFFITGSDGGAVGDFHLLVVDRFGGRLTVKDASDAIYAAFGHPVKCDDGPEAPNVGGIKWLSGHRVLVAAEILPHSVCDSMGTFKAYELDPATMKVGRRYGQLEAKKLFGSDLGEELIGAEDGCIRQPTSCYVSTNHPELKPR
jgi:hypothetical protein